MTRSPKNVTQIIRLTLETKIVANTLKYNQIMLLIHTLQIKQR